MWQNEYPIKPSLLMDDREIFEAAVLQHRRFIFLKFM
jgi:hypothetical protein